MRPTMLALFLISAGTSALAIAPGQDLNAQTVGHRAITLLKTDVAGVEGKEWKVITVELAPGVVDARHVHPGVELVYVLEGAGFLEMEGKPPVALNPGVAAALTPKHIHVLKNTSRTQTLKVLVILLLEKGQPRLALADRIPNADSRQPKTDEQNNSTRPGLVF